MGVAIVVEHHLGVGDRLAFAVGDRAAPVEAGSPAGDRNQEPADLALHVALVQRERQRRIQRGVGGGVAGLAGDTGFAGGESDRGFLAVGQSGDADQRGVVLDHEGAGIPVFAGGAGAQRVGVGCDGGQPLEGAVEADDRGLEAADATNDGPDLEVQRRIQRGAGGGVVGVAGDAGVAGGDGEGGFVAVGQAGDGDGVGVAIVVEHHLGVGDRLAFAVGDRAAPVEAGSPAGDRNQEPADLALHVALVQRERQRRIQRGVGGGVAGLAGDTGFAGGESDRGFLAVGQSGDADQRGVVLDHEGAGIPVFVGCAGAQRVGVGRDGGQPLVGVVEADDRGLEAADATNHGPDLEVQCRIQGRTKVGLRALRVLVRARSSRAHRDQDLVLSRETRDCHHIVDAFDLGGVEDGIGGDVPGVIRACVTLTVVVVDQEREAVVHSFAVDQHGDKGCLQGGARHGVRGLSRLARLLSGDGGGRRDVWGKPIDDDPAVALAVLDDDGLVGVRVAVGGDRDVPGVGVIGRPPLERSFEPVVCAGCLADAELGGIRQGGTRDCLASRGVVAGVGA